MKFKRTKNADVHLDAAVVGSMANTSRSLRPKKVVILAVVLALLLTIGALLYFFVFNKSLKEEPKKEPAAVAVITFTDEQLKAAATKEVDAKKNIEEARLKAEALAQLEDPAGAAAVYEQIQTAGTGNYQDTINYAGVVLLTGDYQKAITLFEASIVELNNSSESDDVKKTETEKLQTKIRALKKEAGL